MAKEMMIVFVYDTAKCCKEEDDPAEAVMYFHPAWVSLTQRLALAGQLMGVHHFLTTSFSAPRFITLQGGKFVLKKFDQYVLAVGTDRNIQDWILERRADILESLLKFFHCDFTRILESLNNDRNKFTEKLYQMFETYLPILQYSANLFSNIPIIKLPKSASNIFLEAIQVLQHFQETNGVLGGALFYNNKIVATQLGADLTKQIVITDPYRIKAPAERVPTEFHLPVGVQLLQVYVEQKQLTKLIQHANNERYYHLCLDIITKKMSQGKKGGIKEPPISGNIPSGMKRDASRIFTVFEEGEDGESVAGCSSNLVSQYVPSIPLAVHDSPPPVRRKQETKATERPIKAAITSSLTPSVCATPLKDVNRILHDTAMLICGAPDDVDDEDKKENCGENDHKKTSSLKKNNSEDDDIPDVVKQALRSKRLNKLKNATSKERLMKKKEPDRKSVSMPNLSSINFYSNSISSCRPEPNKRPFKFSEDSPGDCQLDSPHWKSLIVKDKRHSRTITDPCYPVFRYDGLSVSQSLYEQYVASCYDYELRNSNIDDRIHEHCDDSLHDDQSLKNLSSDKEPSEKSSISNNESISKDAVHEICTAEDGCAYHLNQTQPKQSHNRREMRLPLKSVNLLDKEKNWGTCGGSGSCKFTQIRKDGLYGLQLTPLMSKLSMLAYEQQSRSLRNSTPSEIRPDSTYASVAGFAHAAFAPVATKLSAGQQIEQTTAGMSIATATKNREFGEASEEIMNKNQLATGTWDTDEEPSCMKQTELFLCGWQNMVLVLLMESGTANNPELIHALWQTCVSTLGKLEMRLQQCLEPLPSTDSTELYSILSVDPQWDTIQRTGLWGVAELEIVSCLHDRFLRSNCHPKSAYLTDIIVRTEDTVVYGNRCGRIEVFYQQTMSPGSFGTLPTPADLMGIVALKAKRRLERDHGIVLL